METIQKARSLEQGKASSGQKPAQAETSGRFCIYLQNAHAVRDLPCSTGHRQ